MYSFVLWILKCKYRKFLWRNHLQVSSIQSKHWEDDGKTTRWSQCFLEGQVLASGLWTTKWCSQTHEFCNGLSMEPFRGTQPFLLPIQPHPAFLAWNTLVDQNTSRSSILSATPKITRAPTPYLLFYKMWIGLPVPTFPESTQLASFRSSDLFVGN